MKRFLSTTVVSLVVVLVLAFYAEMIAHLPAAAYDFHIFYAAAGVLHGGGNPFDIYQLFRQEQHLYPALMRDPWQRQWIQHNPYVQSPLLLVALLPLLHWPASAAYLIWMGGLGGATILALALLARLWPLRQPLRRGFWLLISPVAFVGPFLGQVDAVLLLSFVLALWWITRDRYLPAGVVLALGFVKPQIMIGPIVLLALLALRHKRAGQYAGGLLLGATAAAGITALFATPTLLVTWLDSMVRFTHQTVYIQDDISSLTALYIRWLPHSWFTALSLGIVVAWLGLCVWSWRRARNGEAQRWWLLAGLVGWMLATPYAHPHDDVLLVPVLWFLFRPTVAAPTVPARRLLTAALVAWWLFPLDYMFGLDKWVRLPVAGFGIVPVALLAALVWAQRPRLAAAVDQTRAVAHARVA